MTDDEFDDLQAHYDLCGVDGRLRDFADAVQAASRERCAKLLIAEASRLAGRGDYGQGYLVHQLNMLERLAAEIRGPNARANARP